MTPPALIDPPDLIDVPTMADYHPDLRDPNIWAAPDDLTGFGPGIDDDDDPNGFFLCEETGSVYPDWGDE